MLKRLFCKLYLILAVCTFTSLPDSFAVEIVSSPSPSAIKSEEESVIFLALPSVDFELIQPSKQEASPRMPEVGDRIDLRIVQSETAAGLKVDLSLSGARTPTLEEQGWALELKESAMGSAQEVVSAILLKPGKLTLPSLPLRDSSGKAVARTHPFTLEVTSAIKSTDPKPEQPESLEPPVGLQFPIWIAGSIVLLGAVLLLGLVYGIFRWYQVRKLRISQLPKVVQTEDEVALAKLNELEKQGLLKRGDYKSYYFKLSEILKSYVGARYQFDAPESTTAEMISLLEEHSAIHGSLPDSGIDRLESLFNRLDLVKFTDFVPETEISVKLLGDAKEFILTTRRPPTILVQTGVKENASR